MSTFCALRIFHRYTTWFDTTANKARLISELVAEFESAQGALMAAGQPS